MTRAPVLLWPFLALLLSACASSAPSVRAWEDEGAESCEHGDAEHCVVLACEEETCGLFDCEDVAPEVLALAPRGPGVELAQGAYRLPGRAPVFRNWRSLGIRRGSQPRMTFHFRYREGFLPALQPRETGKRVKHHLFPQEERLALWFQRQGVDIHKYTMLIPEHIHREIHGGTGRGGMWNQAWREFRDANYYRNVPPEELHRKAVELIFRFELTGPVMPYSTRVDSFGPQLHGP